MSIYDDREVSTSTHNSDLIYLSLLADVLHNGQAKIDRTGTGTIGLFGTRMEFDINKEFPLLTTKRLSFHNIKHELIWFMRGDTNLKYLHENNVHIWDEWATSIHSSGDMGPIYGRQWRKWWNESYFNGIDEFGQPIETPVYTDQLQEALDTIRNNPDSRRIIVTAWNPADIPFMALPPCHIMFQFYVEPSVAGDKGETLRRQLSCQIYQRSADMFLGVPYNIASYALLTHILAKMADLDVGRLIWVGGDTHIYLNHLEQVREQLSRPPISMRPQAWLAPNVNWQQMKFEEITGAMLGIKDYNPLPSIKGDVSI